MLDWGWPPGQQGLLRALALSFSAHQSTAVPSSVPPPSSRHRRHTHHSHAVQPSLPSPPPHPPQVTSKFYGCGNPVPQGITGLRVLDLGSGSGGCATPTPLWRAAGACGCEHSPHSLLCDVRSTSRV